MGPGQVMRRFTLLLVALFMTTAPAYGQTVTPVSDLIGAGSEYDQVEVTVEGELVGDLGERRDGTVWTQLNDDSYARDPLRETGTHGERNTGIGVRIDGSLGYEFDRVGGYRWRGPLVLATGIWHYHDSDRGGESYLEVTGLEILEAPRLLSDPASAVQWTVGAVLAGIVALLYLRLRQRSGEP